MQSLLKALLNGLLLFQVHLLVGVDQLFEKYPAGLVSLYLQMFQNQTAGGWSELQQLLDTDPRITLR